MTSPRPQGDLTVERMCGLAGVGRPGYYRHWKRSAPRQEETAVRDLIQQVALANRFYGYRRVTKELFACGVVVNHKRVLRLMRRDNLLCLRKRPFVPVTTDSRHDWHVELLPLFGPYARLAPAARTRFGVSLWTRGSESLPV